MISDTTLLVNSIESQPKYLYGFSEPDPNRCKCKNCKTTTIYEQLETLETNSDTCCNNCIRTCSELSISCEYYFRYNDSECCSYGLGKNCLTCDGDFCCCGMCCNYCCCDDPENLNKKMYFEIKPSCSKCIFTNELKYQWCMKCCCVNVFYHCIFINMRNRFMDHLICCCITFYDTKAYINRLRYSGPL